MTENTPTALVLQHDLLQILAGRTMTVGTLGGGQVAIRMYGTDEFIAYQHGLIDEHPEYGGSKISREQAEDQTRHWNLEEMLRSRLRGAAIGPTHVLHLSEAHRMDADPRTFARAVCSCGDYTSSVDTPSGATRAWVAHWQAKTKGIGR